MDPNRRNSQHVPVMAGEVVRILATEPHGAYLDLTLGLGGHLLALAEELEKDARLYGVDRDAEAVKIARQNLSSVVQPWEVERASYVDIDAVADRFTDHQFDGILLDLGLSSLQLNQPERGFSFDREGPLDMRFDQKEGLRTAAELVNGLTQSQLTDLFRQYGEERHSGKIAATIVRERQKEMILTTTQLKAIISATTPPAHRNKTLARIFQALRIAVNDELEGLQRALPQIVGRLKSGGRLAVLSYHSLEDRIIKRFFQAEAKGCICPPELPACVCGRTPAVNIITRKAINPTAEEVQRNSRARSAKLRAAERI